MSTARPIAPATPGTGPTVDLHGAACLMQVHYQTVADLIKAGKLPAAKVGRAYVILTRHVMDHIEREVARQTAERLGAPAVRSPKRRRQVAAPQVRVAQ